MRTPARLSVTAEVRLQRIRAITDVALSHLDDEDLLGAVLDRVREILKVDTAVLLLIDASRQLLVATAARGIEEEIHQSVQVPLGQGFAGRVAAERRPVTIENVDSGKVVNQLLVQRGLVSLLGVPLLVGGELLGVLHVGTVTARRFTTDEVDFLQLAADRAALAAYSLRTSAERTAVRELQRSLVPNALPTIPGVEMAARYSPGTSVVGGDWYDVFTLRTGRVGVVMGDVGGQGLHAAVIMGRMRSALRAYALEFDDPARVLDKLDVKIQHFELGVVATILYVVFDPDFTHARIASAGHWPPVLAAPGRAAELLEIEAGTLIGVDDEPRRRSTRVEIPRGGLLCLYTDGLIERRDTSVDTTLARLCATVEPGPPDAICAAVMAAMIGREPVRDDVALLAVRRTP